MTTLASQITSLTIVYSTVYSGAHQRKHQSSASLAFVRGIHRRPVNSPHKWPVTRKMFPFDNVIMKVLGVTVDDRLQFSEHVSAFGSKAAWQLNTLSRPCRHINLKSKSIIYKSFIASNFNYCPLVWHFCGTVNNNKLEKLQERSLRILYNDFDLPI